MSVSFFSVEPAAPATSAAQRSDDASGDAELEDASGSGESVSSVGKFQYSYLKCKDRVTVLW